MISTRPRGRASEFFDRSAQDDLLQLRNDLMTVYREFSAEDPRLFPLRYARTVPRRARTTRSSPRDTAEPQVPVLLIPDGPARASVLPYDALRRSMAGRGLDVLMMEHRGVGLSRLDAEGEDLPLSAMSLREVIGDLVAVLDHARVERAAVVGSGYGAYLAQALAVLHPERVHSLVLDSPLTSARTRRPPGRRCGVCTGRVRTRPPPPPPGPCADWHGKAPSMPRGPDPWCWQSTSTADRRRCATSSTCWRWGVDT